MVAMGPPAVSAGSPEPPRPGAEPPCAAAVAVRPDALPPEADPLRGSEEPPRSAAVGGLRGDVGFIGWLDTRRSANLTPLRRAWDVCGLEIVGLPQRAGIDPGGDQPQLVLGQRVPGG